MYRYSVFKRNTYIFIYTIYTAVYHIYMYIYRYTPSLAFQRITGRICFTVTASGGWWGVANEWMDQKKEVYFCNFWVLYHAPKKTYLPSKLNHLFKKKKTRSKHFLLGCTKALTKQVSLLKGHMQVSYYLKMPSIFPAVISFKWLTREDF